MTVSPNPKINEDDLLDALKSSALREEAGDKSLRALLWHLADLGLLKPLENGDWEIATDTTEADESRLIDLLPKKLGQVCNGPKEIALKYFLKDLPDTVSLAYPDPSGFEGAISEGVLDKSGSSSEKASSNLSNLQIVKKVGRQLSPLIEMENEFLEKLEGRFTDRQRARHIFNYIISRVKMKGEPRKWVQLSRRHR